MWWVCKIYCDVWCQQMKTTIFEMPIHKSLSWCREILKWRICIWHNIWLTIEIKSYKRNIAEEKKLWMPMLTCKMNTSITEVCEQIVLSCSYFLELSFVISFFLYSNAFCFPVYPYCAQEKGWESGYALKVSTEGQLNGVKNCET